MREQMRYVDSIYLRGVCLLLAAAQVWQFLLIEGTGQRAACILNGCVLGGLVAIFLIVRDIRKESR